MKSLFSRHIELTAKVMDMRLKRQNVVMSNMANIGTPNYKVRTLEFEKQLQNALGLGINGRVTRTSGQHMPSTFDPKNFGPEWTKEFKPRLVHGEDNVDLDKEMAKMAKNNMLYTTLAQVIKKNFQGIEKIITEGKA